jgi:hypothetical protein
MPITLDTSRHFSECRGERTPEDPHYHVAFFQGGPMKKKIVLLPFDAQGRLVPDDNKTEPWKGTDVEGKPVLYHPLWNQDMRDYLALKEKRSAAVASRPEEEEQVEDMSIEQQSEEVNLVAYLKGQQRYEWALVQAAARKRYSRVFTSKKQLVEDLVLDEKIVPEHELAAEFQKLLPAKEAA